MKQFFAYVWLVVKRMFSGLFWIGDALGILSLFAGLQFSSIPLWLSLIIFNFTFIISSYYVWESRKNTPSLDTDQKQILLAFSDIKDDGIGKRILLAKTMGGLISVGNNDSILQAFGEGGNGKVVATLTSLVNEGYLSHEETARGTEIYKLEKFGYTFLENHNKKGGKK